MNQIAIFIGISMVGFCVGGMFGAHAFDSGLCILISLAILLKKFSLEDSFNTFLQM